MRRQARVDLTDVERGEVSRWMLLWPGNILGFDQAAAVMGLLDRDDLVRGTGFRLRLRLIQGEPLTNVDVFRLLRLAAVTLDQDPDRMDPAFRRRSLALRDRLAASLDEPLVPSAEDMTSDCIYDSDPQLIRLENETEGLHRLVFKPQSPHFLSVEVAPPSAYGSASLWVATDAMTGPGLESAIGVAGDRVASIGERVRPRNRPRVETVSTWEITSELPEYADVDEHLRGLWDRAGDALLRTDRIDGRVRSGLSISRHHNGAQWQGHGIHLDNDWFRLLDRLHGDLDIDAYIETDEQFREDWSALTS